MYAFGLTLHSGTRCLVLAALLLALFRSARGYFSQLPFTRSDNAIRHWTATIAHVQLMVGMFVYTQSPVVAYFWKNRNESFESRDAVFFGLVHFGLMFLAIVLLTIGSAKAKREAVDRDKFKTMWVYFLLALLVILLAVPWPFSPLAQRPYFR